MLQSVLLIKLNKYANFQNSDLHSTENLARLTYFTSTKYVNNLHRKQLKKKVSSTKWRKYNYDPYKKFTFQNSL